MSEEKNEEISLVDVYRKLNTLITFLWSRKIIIVVTGLLGGMFGFFYAFMSAPQYEGRLTFIVESSSNSRGLGGLSSLASSFGLGGIGEDGGLYDNQVNLINYLKSRSTLEDVLLTEVANTKETFAQRFVDKYGWSEAWENDELLSNVHFRLDYPREKYTRQQDSILNKIHLTFIEGELINIQLLDDDGTIVGLTVSTIDDTLSKYMPEQLLSHVSNKYINTKTKLVKENVAMLQHQTDSVRSRLNSSLYSAASATDQVFGLNPAMNVKRVPATKEQIDIQSSTILLGELIKNLELAKMQLKDQTPIIEIIDKPIFPLEIDKLSKKKALIIGSVLGGFLSVSILLFWRFMKQLKMQAAEKDDR
jgi:hypothetical protein